MFKNFRNVLLISAFVVVFAAFIGCSGDHDWTPPPGPEPVENADVTGFWHMVLGIDVEQFGDLGTMKMVPMNGEPDEEGTILRLIIEFPLPEQDEDGSFSYTGPVEFMGVFVEELTIEGKVDGNVITATVSQDGFVMTFQGTVDGNKITGIWTLEEGEGPEITFQGLKMKTLVAPAGEEILSGPFSVVISDREHIPPRVAGAWEVLSTPYDVDAAGAKPLCWETPYGFMQVYQEGWVFSGYGPFEDDYIGFGGVVYLDGTVLMIAWIDGDMVVFEGTLEGDILTGTFEYMEDIFTVANGDGDDLTTIRIHVKPYWHTVSNAASIKNIFAWDPESGEMPQEVEEALAAHPYASDVWLPTNPVPGEDSGYLPPAADGDYYAWWGANPTGTFEYLGMAHESTFTSDEIQIPGAGPVAMNGVPVEGDVTLSLDYWYGIESLAEFYFDEFIVLVLVKDYYPNMAPQVSYDGWYAYQQFELTPQSNGDDPSQEEINFSSPGAPDKTPEWVHAELELDPWLIGKTIKIRLYSRTGDSLFNEFRGHGLDNVTITVNEEEVFFDGFEVRGWDRDEDMLFDDEDGPFGMATISPNIPATVLQQRSLQQ